MADDNNLKTFKIFLLMYIALILLLNIFGLGVGEFPELSFPADITKVPSFIFNIVIFIKQLIFYSVDSTIGNLLLWGFRIIIILEIITYVRDLFKL